MDTRRSTPKKRTRFPGQLIYCGICGRMYVFGGHGQKDHLMCNGAREHRCWNGVTVNGPLAARKITAALLETIAALPDFDEAFIEAINAEARQIDRSRVQTRQELERRITRREREIENMVRFVGAGDTSSSVREGLQRLEREQQRDKYELRQLVSTAPLAIEVPSVEEVKAIARAAINAEAPTSWEFSPLMHRLIPRIVVFPYRRCDGGGLVLRAQFRLYLSRLLPNRVVGDALERPLMRVLSVDLFKPARHEEFRECVIAMRAERDENGRKRTEQYVADALGITTTEAQRAASLQRKMNGLGLTEAYVPVTEPPDDLPKLRRHKHPRYRFEPLPGAGEF